MLNIAKKIYHYGLYNSWHIIKNRAVISGFCYGQGILRKIFFARKPKSFRSFNFSSQLCKKKTHKNCLLAGQEQYNFIATYLGSEKRKRFPINWHSDFRLQEKQKFLGTFNSQLYFNKLLINTYQKDDKSLGKDIKIPWELSRLHQLPILAHAYEQTKDIQFAEKIFYILDDWRKNNTFLYGVNWRNAMEVGIRATNSILAVSILLNAGYVISNSQKQAFLEYLYEHLFYITYNLEWYDGKTSNHYLADLVGYLCITAFLQEKKRIAWVIKELKKELKKQIFTDGSSYEGSTKYHFFVREMVYYSLLIVTECAPEEKNFFKQVLAEMDLFLWWITYGSVVSKKLMITIGDDDGGNLAPFNHAQEIFFKAPDKKDNKKTYYFASFGLSVYKTNFLHLSLRHYSYQNKQLTNHFHNDAGSITLAVNKEPIIVDPGAYVYTPSVYWRNCFRSASVHNSSYIKSSEPAALKDTIFYLSMAPKKVDCDTLFYTQHEQYEEKGLLFTRKVKPNEKVIKIYDTWSVLDDKKNLGLYKETQSSEEIVCWNYTMHPSIVLQKKGPLIQCFLNKDLIAVISSKQLVFSVEKSWYSPTYGVKQATTCIRAQLPVNQVIKSRLITIIKII